MRGDGKGGDGKEGDGKRGDGQESDLCVEVSIGRSEGSRVVLAVAATPTSTLGFPFVVLVIEDRGDLELSLHGLVKEHTSTLVRALVSKGYKCWFRGMIVCHKGMLQGVG